MERLFILLSFTFGASLALQCTQTNDNLRFDCYPESGASQSKCEARGCCWAPAKSGDVKPPRRWNTTKGGPQINVPYCYYPSDYPGYSFNGIATTSYGYTVNFTRSTKSYYPNDIMNLRLDAYFENDNRLRIKIYDPSQARYEVPIDTPPFTQRARNPLYQLAFDPPFGVSVLRISTGEVIFNTSINPGFIYADQFIQMSTPLSSSFIYGLGEHRSSLALPTDWQVFTFWARDQPPSLNSNLYGVHPFYINMEPDGLAHGVFLLNSNAMDVILQPAPALTYRTIGGILDFYILLGPDPIDLVRQYHGIVGMPFMPPMWALGFHLCRWGYNSANGTLAVVERMRNAMIPQDVQWNDIEYSIGRKDFTLNTETFGSLPDLIANIHAHGQHYIPIIDPAISSSQTPGTYPPYDTGITDNVFIKTEDGKVFIGQVWPGDTAFPDWFHPNTSSWWETLAQKFHDTVDFDGMWLDMNEPSNFIDGTKDGCPDNSYNNPPYVPAVVGQKLYSRTVCPSARQSPSLHYNLHSLYGISEVMVSFNTLKNILKKRPFIISRSSFPSSGRYGGHWLGDNRSEWPEMHYSIIGILNFNMFAIPMVGADICGFSGNTNEELCTRWMQLGAFYPFSRNHNGLGNKDQDPAAFSKASQDSSRDALLIRYSLIPYYYTWFMRAHINGSMVARPLFFDFPGLPELYLVDTQFMIGEAILVSPVLTQGATTVNATFPPSKWYDNYGAAPITVSKTTSKILDAPLNKINIHLRGSKIIPSVIPGLTVNQTRGNPFMLIVCLDIDLTAAGEMYWDDGESLDTFERGQYILFNFTAANNTVTSTIVHDGFAESSSLEFYGAVIFGVITQPSSATINGQACKLLYQKDYEKLSLTCPYMPFNKPLTIRWS
ncbi:lysosomal alpha-glucosidase-like isoform X1 [Diadema antillarum]|uniref:lysosomal alpha-glucosidase-like isoform X1 n=1 Tax=Diadema antillarum TaxID=105358 RepID=UPI003A8510CD